MFTNLRLQRRVNDFYRQRVPGVLDIDDAIAQLLEGGETELALRLITPKDEEYPALAPAMARLHGDGQEGSGQVNEDILALIAQKTADFELRLNENLPTLPERMRERVSSEARVFSADPEAALDIPASFWEQYLALPEDTRYTVMSAQLPLETTIHSLHAISHGGMLRHLGTLLPIVGTLPEGQREAFVTGMSNALAVLRERNGGLDVQPDTIRFLGYFSDPEMALALASEVSPNQEANRALYSLSLMLGVQYENGKPPHPISGDVAALLPGICDALLAVGTPRHNLDYLTRGLLTLHTGPDDQLLPGLVASLSQCQELALSDPHDAGDYGLLSEKKLGDELATILAAQGKYGPEETRLRLETYSAKLQAVRNVYDARLKSITEVRDKKRAAAKAEAAGNPPEPEDPELENPELESPEREKPEAESKYPALLREHGLNTFFASLDIPDEIGAEMYEAWDSFSAFVYAETTFKIEKIKDLDDEQLRIGAMRLAAVLYEQASHVQSYCERYGSEEAIQLHNTFGIVNFGRATPQQFHNQLMRWEGTVRGAEGVFEPTVNISVAAPEDYNIAFKGAAKKFFETFGEPGSFYFEARSKKALSRAFVKVGNRERAAGRDPQQESAVRNVIISGHGAPDGLALSHHGILDVEAYVEAMLRMNKFNDSGGKAMAVPNDYSRHLGSAYRVILDACSTGAEVPLAINISDAIYAHHGRPTEAPPADSYGSVIDPVTQRVQYAIDGPDGKRIMVDSVRSG